MLSPRKSVSSCFLPIFLCRRLLQIPLLPRQKIFRFQCLTVCHAFRLLLPDPRAAVSCSFSRSLQIPNAESGSIVR